MHNKKEHASCWGSLARLKATVLAPVGQPEAQGRAKKASAPNMCPWLPPLKAQAIQPAVVALWKAWGMHGRNLSALDAMDFGGQVVVHATSAQVWRIRLWSFRCLQALVRAETAPHSMLQVLKVL